MRNKKLPEFTFLLTVFTEIYAALIRAFPNTVRSYKHSFRLLFQYIHQVKKKEAGEILFRIWIMRQLTDSYGGLRQNGDARYPQGTSGFQRLLLLPLMHRTGTLKRRLCLPMRSGGCL